MTPSEFLWAVAAGVAMWCAILAVVEITVGVIS